MNDDHRKLLRRYTSIFLMDLEPRKLLPHLVEVLDTHDEHEIKCQTTRELQVEKLLEILPRRGPQAFSFFLEALTVVQPFLADPLREEEEIEKRLTETNKELGRARTHSANLRNQLSSTTVQLETLKTKHEKTCKERKELESLHQTLLIETKNENQKLLFKLNEFGFANETLKKELQEQKQLKFDLESKFHDLQTVLENKSKEITNLREKELRAKVSREKHNKDSQDAKDLSRKLSLDETKRQFRREILRRRAYSEKSSIESMNGEENEKIEEIIWEKHFDEDNGKTLDILHSERETIFKCFENELEKLSNELTRVETEKDLAKLECTQLRDKLAITEKEPTNLQDRSTSPMVKSVTDNSQCAGCKTLKAECEKLQKQIEIVTTGHNEEIRNLTSRTNEITDKFERGKKSLEMEIVSLKKLYDTSKEDYKNLQNEMAEQHLQDLKDQCTMKADLTAQIDKDRHFVSRLKSELDKERDNNRTLQKEYEKFKKKAKSDKKQLKQQLEQETKNTTSKAKESETALKDLRDGERRNLEEITKLRKNISELQSKFCQVEDELERWRCLPGRVFNFKKEFDRNGVIYTLGTNFNSSPFTNPASNNNCSITVTRSSHSNGHPTDLLDLRKGTLSCTRDEENSWWRVDLGENYTLFATHYTLRHGRDNGLSVIRNWNLEGSLDGRTWKILRRHENDRALKEPFPFFTGTWAVEGKIEAMRYFRIHQTGKNSSGRYALCLSGFEIYGILLFMQG